MHILYVHTHVGCVCTDVLLCGGDSCVSVSTMHCTCCVLLCVCVLPAVCVCTAAEGLQ